MAKKKTKKKRPVGRPTAYKANYPEKVDEYIAKCEETEEEKERELPTKAGLACIFNVSLVTIDTWEKTHPDFLCALERLKRSQQKHLINRGLNGTGNSTIAKLLLSANHGISEQQKIEHSGEAIVIKMPDKFKDI